MFCNAENYCSNIFADLEGCAEKSPWCFTEDREKRWELCDIPMCESKEIPEMTNIVPASKSLFYNRQFGDCVYLITDLN